MKLKNVFIIFIFAIITLLGITVPGIILHINFSSKLNKSSRVDETLYNVSNSAMSRNASLKLTEYERLKLICGSWTSELEELDTSEADISEVNAVNMARNAVNTLYSYGVYPYNFDSSYDNWYSWKTSYYKCTETSFHTYSAYYWKVSFYRYDTNELHNIYITDNGTLFAIDNNNPDDSADMLNNNVSWKLQDISNGLRKYFTDEYSKYGSITYIKNISSDNIPTYENIDEPNTSIFSSSEILTDDAVVINNDSIKTADDLKSMNISTLSESTCIYHIFQLYDDNNFILYIIPWEAQH